MISFNSSFWGEKHNGFDVLYHNMKAGLLCSRELEEYIKESCVVEETYMKLQNKLAKMATNYGNRGSFGPFWQLLRLLSERLSSSHQGIFTSWQALMRDVHKYTLELQKRHREVKEKEGTTVDAVQSLQQTSAALQKSKEFYHARSVELERLKRDGGSPKEVEKVDAKVKKANEEYRGLIDKYNNLRNDFITHMSASCQRFQLMEEKHLGEMRVFVERYHQAREMHCQAICKAQSEFKESFGTLSVEKLIGMIVESKATGSIPPAVMEFQEANITAPAPSGVTSSLSMLDISSSGEHNRRSQIGGGILSIPMYRNHKKKTKDNHKADVPAKSPYLVDEAGYSIKPEDTTSNKRSSFDSSSDDSDNDATSNSGGRISKLRVEIKPIQGTGMVKEGGEVGGGRGSAGGMGGMGGGGRDLREIIQSIKLTEVAPKSNNRRTPVSEMTTKLQVKPSDDLINLDLFLLPNPPSSSSPLPNTTSSSATATTTTTAVQLETSVDPVVFISENGVNTSGQSTSSSLPPSSTSSLPSSSIPLHNGSDRDDCNEIAFETQQQQLQLQQARPQPQGTITASQLSQRPLPPLPSVTLKADSPLLFTPPSIPPALPPPKVYKSSTTAAAANHQTQLPSVAKPRPSGRNTPDFKFFSNNRSESVLSLNNVFTTSPAIPPHSSLTSPPPTSLPTSPPAHLPSRGPSPLSHTRGESIPVAMAVSESVNAFFHGANLDRCQAKTTGNIVVSFPGGIVKGHHSNHPSTLLPSLPPLSFSLQHTSRVEHLLLNKQLLSEEEPTDGSRVFTFNMPALLTYLKKQAMTNKTAAYFNVEVIKYQLKGTTPAVLSTPLRLVCYWKSTPSQADFRLDYTYHPPSHPDSLTTTTTTTTTPHPENSSHPKSIHNSSNSSLSSNNSSSIFRQSSSSSNDASINSNPPDSPNHSIPSPATMPSQSTNPSPATIPSQPSIPILSKLQVSIQLECKDDDVKMESVPVGIWSSEVKRATWKLPDITSSKPHSIKAKFAVASQTSLASNLCVAQFVVEGSTVSGMQVALTTPGYRLSLAKRRLFSGKYFSEAEIVKPLAS